MRSIVIMARRGVVTLGESRCIALFIKSCLSIIAPTMGGGVGPFSNIYRTEKYKFLIVYV